MWLQYLHCADFSATSFSETKMTGSEAEIEHDLDATSISEPRGGAVIIKADGDCFFHAAGVIYLLLAMLMSLVQVLLHAQMSI